LSGSTASSPLRGFVSLLPPLFLIIFSPCEHMSWAAGVVLLMWVREAGVVAAGRVPGCGTRRVEARGPALTEYVQTMAPSQAQPRRSVTSPRPRTTSPCPRIGSGTRGSTRAAAAAEPSVLPSDSGGGRLERWWLLTRVMTLLRPEQQTRHGRALEVVC
jgi:hypothetical protein